MTGKVIAAVNRKGGVGKTTLVIALADTLVSEFRASVVVVDLDPQASASISLLGPEQTLARSEQGKSLTSIVRELVTSPEADVTSYVVGQVNRIRARANVAFGLVSNGEELWDFEFDLKGSSAVLAVKNTVTTLLSKLRESFDFVLIDCPPGQTHTSSAALAAADLIISPTVPDRLSSWGLDGLQRYIESHSNGRPKKAFFVATRYRAQLNEHKEYFDLLTKRTGSVALLKRESETLPLGDADVAIGTFLDEDKRYVERLGDDTPKTLIQIYGQKAAVQLIDLAKAIRRELQSE